MNANGHGHSHAHDHSHVHVPASAQTDAGLGIAVQDLTVCYGDRPALHHLTFTLPSAGFVAVVGPNGSGKSTLLRTLLGFHAITSGSLHLPMSRRAIAYLPQRDASDADFPATVADVVAMGCVQDRGMFASLTEDDRERCAAAIAELGLTRVATRPFAALSGGQRQRVLLARALATKARVFLLDEPLAGLDAPAQHDLLTRLAAWGHAGRLVIAVLHDLGAAARACSHAVLLATHLVAAGPAATVLTRETLHRCFGRDPELLLAGPAPMPHARATAGDSATRSGDPQR